MTTTQTTSSRKKPAESTTILPLPVPTILETTSTVATVKTTTDSTSIIKKPTTEILFAGTGNEKPVINEAMFDVVLKLNDEKWDDQLQDSNSTMFAELSAKMKRIVRV